MCGRLREVDPHYLDVYEEQVKARFSKEQVNNTTVEFAEHFIDYMLTKEATRMCAPATALGEDRRAEGGGVRT